MRRRPKFRRETGYTLLAMGPRADVLFLRLRHHTLNCTKQSNGVGWYYDGSYSWGFALGGDAFTLTRASPDKSGFPDVEMR